MKFRVTYKLVLVALLLSITAFSAMAQQYRAPENLFPRHGLDQRIGFWKDIFTKYGKDQLVFHYRDYPWIIYDVVDFSGFDQVYSGPSLKDAKDRAAKLKTKEIEASLSALANGAEAQNDMERRIVNSFVFLPGGRSKYLLAMGEDQIRNQTGVRDLFMEGIKRSGRYLYAIEAIFSREGLPVELSRLPLVESSFNYNAYSGVGAAGIWQFMPKTGAKYMIVNSAIDERRDPMASTRAAAQYLKHSYEVLGSWPVSVTSYNHGLGGIAKAVKNAGTNDMATIIKRYMGDGFGFASQNFYCEFIAALEVEKNYRFYFPDLQKESPWYVEEIRIERAHKLPDLLRMTGLSKEEFLSHNLALLDPVAKGRTSVPGGFSIKIPKGSGSYAIAHQNLKATQKPEIEHKVLVKKQSNKKELERLVNEDREETTYPDKYKVQKGDSVFSIARKFKVSGNDLMAANDLTSPKALRVGRTISVPNVGRARLKNDKVSELPPAKTDVAQQKSNTNYTIRKGDTLYSIAKKFNTTSKKLEEANSIAASKIKPGQKIVVR